MKGPKDRLLMMTESIDQSFQRLPKDCNGMYGGMTLLPHEKKKMNDRELNQKAYHEYIRLETERQ